MVVGEQRGTRPSLGAPVLLWSQVPNTSSQVSLMVSGTRQRRATSSAVENIRSVCSYCGVWSPGQQSEEVCTRQPVSCFGDYQMSRSEQTRRGQQPGEAQGMLFFSQENIRLQDKYNYCVSSLVDNQGETQTLKSPFSISTILSWL